MRKILMLLLGLSVGQFAYTQLCQYEYVFIVDQITDYGPAKMVIKEIRNVMGVKIVKFLDDNDQFVVSTHLDFDPIELVDKFEQNGVNIVGVIKKIRSGCE